VAELSGSDVTPGIVAVARECMGRIIGEVVEVELHPNHMNREDGFSLETSHWLCEGTEGSPLEGMGRPIVASCSPPSWAS